VVGTMNTGLSGMAKQRKVRTVTGNARFLSANELEIETDKGRQTLRFEQCIIAAGSQPVKLPGFPWDDPRVMDSTDALLLADVPKELLVVGGGIIGLEMACVYATLAPRSPRSRRAKTVCMRLSKAKRLRPAPDSIACSSRSAARRTATKSTPRPRVWRFTIAASST
jgi:NADH dehydrogenase FAD-containing subunit